MTAVPVAVDAPSASGPAAGAGTRIPPLDGLRAFAVLLVILQHTVPVAVVQAGLFGVGIYGVRLFFVLSGFLIPGILMQSRDVQVPREGLGAALRTFFARRALRIWPLYYLVLLVAVLFDAHGFDADLPWHFLYLSNFRIAENGHWHPLGPLWSLSVEEQFYLVWPFVVLLTPPRRLPAVLIGTVALGLVSRVGLALLGDTVVDDMRATIYPTSALDSLALGGLLAWHVATHPSAALWRARVCGWCGVAGGVVLATVLLLSGTPAARMSQHVGEGLGAALVSLWLVERAARQVRHGAWGILWMKPHVAVGAVSYGVYLYHALFIALVHKLPALFWMTVPPYNAIFPHVVLVVSLSLAFASWRWFEGPINRRKRHFPTSGDRDQVNGLHASRAA